MTPYEAEYRRRIEALPHNRECAECGVPLHPATLLSCCSRCLIAEGLEGLRR